MRIGFDVSQTGQFKTGCGYFADSLARHLVALDTGNNYILYPTFGHGYWDPNWPRDTLDLAHLPNVQRGPGQRSLDQLEAFWIDPPADLEVQLGSPDVIHFCPTNLKRARLVYSLHDLAFTSHPEWTTEANWLTCLDGVLGASVYADHVVAVSNYTRAEFLEAFPHYRPDRVSVVYEASRFSRPSDGPAPRRLGYLRPGQFWLAVGTREPRKNCRRILEAYARLKAASDTDYPLVLFGAGGQTPGDLDQWIESLWLSPDVHRLGYVDDETLAWLYTNCAAFCYPSLFEGFGLPAVEAMSLGAAVLTSNVTSLPEVVGDAGILVDPFDVDAIAAGMRLLAQDSALVSELRARARVRSAEFSWRRAAAQVLDVYRTVLDEYPRTIERKAVLGAIET
jgi:glycosyltransferase involved in cell wall biosynthesis